MELRAAAATDRGRVREQNEDAVLSDVPLVAVADGMGGHAAGEVASSIAVEVVRSWKERLAASSGKEAGELLRQAIDDANRRVWEKGQEDQSLAGMGTTVTAGWIDGDAICLAHVGDSRAYLLRDGKLQQLTTDQNVAQDLVRRGRISEAEAASSPHRHVILQAVGADPEGLDVEVSSVEMRPGDRLMLATDGLFGMVRSADRIREILTEHSDLEEACRVLVDEANAAGGEDNISVVLVDAVATDRTQAAAPAEAGEIRIERTGGEELGAQKPTAEVAPTPDEPGRRLRGTRLALLLGVIAVAVVAAAAFLVIRITSDGLLVAEQGGSVVALRGRLGSGGEAARGDVVHVFTKERIDRFPRTVREDLRSGIPVDSMAEARRVVANLPRLLGPQDTPAPTPSPSPSPPPASPSPGTAALPLRGAPQ